MEIDGSYRKLLGKSGFLALKQGMHKEAGIIFDALALTAPDNPAPILGQAMVQMNMRRYDEAVSTIENNALAKDEKNFMSQAYLGLALFLNEQTDRAKAVLNEVTAQKDDPAAQQLANALLEEMN